LAGLIMWVPAGLVYTAVALTLFALWLQREEARVAGAAGAASVAGAQPQAQPR
jgi:cytochrome c oxidase assembly factor CtaG